MKPAPVSVIIPTFNRGEVLGRAIDSVLRQSLPPAELIIVDDGSDCEKTRTLKKQYLKAKANQSPTSNASTSMETVIHWLEQPNSGVSSARNRGIRHSSHDWLAFLDSDDYWLEKKLEKQLERIHKSGALVAHTEEIWIRNGKRVNQCKHHRKEGGELFERSLHLCLMSPSSILIHKSVIETIGVFDESLPACEDYDLWLRITSRHPVEFLTEPLITKTGGHPDQLSQAYPAMDRFRIQALIKILEHEPLNEIQRTALLKVLGKKVKIYGGGCRKRGKLAEAERIEELFFNVSQVD